MNCSQLIDMQPVTRGEKEEKFWTPVIQKARVENVLHFELLNDRFRFLKFF